MKLKKLSLAFVLTGLFATQAALAVPSTHFDLNSQNFSEADIDGVMVSARYNLPKTYVTTNLKHDSTYHTLDDNGFFKVELKSPLNTWGISLDMGYKFSAYDYEARSIILTAENGVALTITLQRGSDGVWFDGSRVYQPDDDERLTITINKDNTDTVTLNINGSDVASASKPSFDKLKYVEAQLIHEYDQHSSTDDNDAMHNLIIGGE